MYDVVVIGAGPSGLNAARRLAEGGLDVVVLEREKEIGKHVICAGIVGKEVFEEFDLSNQSVLKEVKKVKVVSPFFSSLIYEHPHSFAYVVDREKFDKYLGHKARLNGAEIRFDNEVVDISLNKDCIEVLTRREERYKKKYSAKMAIIATGISYNLHKKLDLGYPKRFLNGVQAEINMSDGDYTSVFIGKDVAPGAFAWFVPIGKDRVRIGLVTEKNPRQYFSNFMKMFYPDRLKELNEGLIQFKPIAQGLASETYGERVLVVGEAAGQVKTTTGGGIYFGLVCSEIASKVVRKRFKEGCFTANALAEYEKLWKKAIQKEILIGYYARKLCGKLSDFQIERIFQIARNDGVIPLIRERGDFDWHSDLILSLLKRLPFLNLLKSKE